MRAQVITLKVSWDCPLMRHDWRMRDDCGVSSYRVECRRDGGDWAKYGDYPCTADSDSIKFTAEHRGAKGSNEPTVLFTLAEMTMVA